MKTFAKLLSLCAVATLFASAQAADGLVPHADVIGADVPLFCNVKYVDLDEMAPCAQPKIVMVKDPCACCDPCGCCAPKCVAIKICVPTCGCETVTCKRDGDRVRYDYGKYAVDIRVKDGYIEVDYQD
ncbi:MAG: hypothetical protein KDA85_01450 [Planctomycetaceae bacterium]|nr:hypothetical protein [Planctomycetaceae bacterium]